MILVKLAFWRKESYRHCPRCLGMGYVIDVTNYPSWRDVKLVYTVYCIKCKGMGYVGRPSWRDKILDIAQKEESVDATTK